MYTFIRYEWKQWFRSPMTWIFLLITTLLIFGAVSSDNIQVGGAVGSVYKNSPFAIQQYYMTISLICLLMTTGFMTATANRDFSTGMYQFVFSSPIKKRDYFFGSFFGAVTIAMIPTLGVTLGALIGPLMPWITPERYGPIVWDGHLQGLLAFAIPNTYIIGVLVYGLAVLFRNNLISFVGAVGILILYVVSGGYIQDLEQEWLAVLLDPFGARPMALMTRYLTVDEKNTQAVGLVGDLLTNRLIWMGLATVLLFGIYARFSFATRSKRLRKAVVSAPEPTPVAKTAAVFNTITPTTAVPAAGFNWRGFLHMIAFEAKALMRNQTFVIILVIGLINLVAALLSFTGDYGLTRYPVTYSVIGRIQGSFYLFVVGIITFYSGVVVWRERDARIAEIEDATPSSLGARFSSKLIALTLSIAVVLSSAIVIGIAVQAFHGYTRFEIGQYVISLLVLDLAGFVYLLVAALLAHYLINNRYIAYFAFVAFVILNAFVWGPLDIQSHMLQFGSTPSMTYSDMNGYGPFVAGQTWFSLYWLLAALLVCFVGYAFAIRGKEATMPQRLREAGSRLRRRSLAIGGVAALFVLTGGFVFYNTQVLNTYKTPDTNTAEQKAYELTYKKYEGMAKPKWVDLTYHLNIYPERRALYSLVHAVAVNATAESISEIHFTVPETMDTMAIDIPGARLTTFDKRLSYRIYTLGSPLHPGDSLRMTITASKVTRGFENEVSFTELTENGTFFNNTAIMPFIGYKNSFEIADKNERIKEGLPPRRRMPVLDERDMAARGRNYLDMDADLVNVRTIITTSGDQTAVAPGSLRRTWTKDGRNGFEYQLDHPSWNFYSFISARYTVARETWNGIDLEVYYIPEHAYNVPNMMNGMRKALSYYTSNFGPYYHKQCRIIEFPRYASFAQAFPGTMPYSEGIGFITDLRDVQGDDIDFVFFVVAHEMAHQWWAHQLLGAEMQGSEMMSESFAEYSALMIMEREYGRETMQKFLAYEMSQYLSGRSEESEAERPIMKTESQAYIHYSKGSVILYYLKEMIGEENMSKALSSLIRNHAYQEAPYPTAVDAVRAFSAVTPDSLQYLIADLFENITVFSNRVVDASYKPVDGGYEVSFSTISEKFYADSLGTETPVPLHDYIDVGVFRDVEGSAEPGKPLLLQRLKVTKKKNTFIFFVKEQPDHVGIDPYNLLIDRLTSDNVKKVTSTGGVALAP